MAQEMNEIDQIVQHIEKGEHFLLSGGAGSGKTYTLVEVIKRIYDKTPKANVACITFTNVAAIEIRDRAPFENLWVSTIHDFLWSIIAPYQHNLKKCLVELVSSEKIRSSLSPDELTEIFDKTKIEYREWVKLKDGIISHDEVITLAENMFSIYPLLRKVVTDKYEFVFIDEYQDTFPSVISIFFEYIQNIDHKSVFGLFGDSMQSIFDNGVGKIENYPNVLFKVEKKENRRCPKSVIDVANNLRDDGLFQEPSSDANSKNYEKKGVAKFLYSRTISDISSIKQNEIFKLWNWENPRETKELYLTHNLISSKAGFSLLMAIYDKDRIIQHVQRIKRYIKNEKIEDDFSNILFEDIAKQFHDSGKVPFNQLYLQFLMDHPNVYEYAKTQKFEDLSQIYLHKDQLIGNKKFGDEEIKRKGDKRNYLIRYLSKIQTLITLYNKKRFNEFLKLSDFKIKKFEHKIFLKKFMDKINFDNSISIGEVIEIFNSNEIMMIDEKALSYIEKNGYVFFRIKNAPYNEFVSLYDFTEGHTVFSTQHNIKGAEFKNVFLILDNGNWNNYNFEALFGGRNSRETVLERTRKIFYVCCTRAEEALVVFYFNPNEKVLETAEKWFGEEHVVEV